MRPRGKDKHLPACVYPRHGAYWYVKKGKWTRLGATLQEALAEYARLMEPASGGFDELLNRTLERCRERVNAGKMAENTLKQYGDAAKQLKKNLAEFTPMLLKPRHVAALLDMDRHKPNMANRKLSFLRLAFKNALTWGLAEQNPTYGVGRLEEAKRDRLVSINEFRAVQAKAAPHLQVIMELAYLTGQRIMDVVKIKLADVSVNGIYFQQQKTRRRLVVRMTPEIQAALDRAKAMHTNVRGLTLFHQRGGRPYSYGAIRDAFRRACALAEVSDYRPNDHRAMSLTAARKQGLNPTALAGHRKQATTDRYLRDRSPEVVEGPSIGHPLDNWTGETKKSTA